MNYILFLRTKILEKSQLFPDITEIFMSMFADDVGLISDTIFGLQRQLYGLQNICEMNKLAVNVEKNKGISI